MKKKTLFKVLPALLIAPILPCYITLYANASEADDQSFFDKLINLTTLQINGQDEYNKPENLSLQEYDYVDEESGRFVVNLKETQIGESTELCAYICDYTSALASSTSYGELTIPIKVTVKIDRVASDYRVVGIEKSALDGSKRLRKCGITKTTINGWENNGGKIDGGWFSSIGSFALQYYYDNPDLPGNALESITFPDCLSSLGVNVCNNNTGLKNVYTQRLSSDKTTIETVQGFPSSLTELPENTFADCYELDFGENGLTIPDNITFIDKMCFQRDYFLKTINIRSGLLSTGVEVFESCTNLENINFSNNNKLTTINQSCFQNCTFLKHIKLPDNMEILSARAFLNCYSLDNIELNNKLTTLGMFCFSNQTEGAAGATASQLQYIYLPESVCMIDQGVFQNNYNLHEVIVAMENVHDGHINKNAFTNCPNMYNITFIWNVPIDIQSACFINKTDTDKICDATPAIDVRFRPLCVTDDYGGRNANMWLKNNWQFSLSNVRFTIKLAGVNIAVHASFLSSKEFCKEYLTSEAADFEETITRDDIAFEAAASEIECSDKYYETLAIYRKIAEALISRDVLLVHGSAVSVGGNCYMFTAPSGVGESTHAALWKKLLGEKGTIINDDKPLLKITNNGVEVFGTPWSGEKSINTNTSAPLKSICFIEQSKVNEIRQIEKASAIDKLVPQIYKSDDAENVVKTLELTNLLMKNVDFYQLKCNTDISAAKLSYKTLTA